MHSDLLTRLVERAIQQDRRRVIVLCVDGAACEANLLRIETLSREAKVTVLTDSVGGIYLNWLHVRFFPIAKREYVEFEFPREERFEIT